jgi:hypothetical protein
MSEEPRWEVRLLRHRWGVFALTGGVTLIVVGLGALVVSNGQVGWWPLWTGDPVVVLAYLIDRWSSTGACNE